MRNLKRALSLALAAIMVLGLMVVGASAASTYDNFTDKDEIVNQEAVNTMVSLGVLAGKDDGSYYDPTGIVTRGEMAKIIAVCLNGGKDPVLGDSTNIPKFSDVPATHWAYNYIAYCVQQNIIAGRGDGTFSPDDPVTGSEAAKMFLCALGYRADLEGLVGNEWELNTNVLANQEADLYDGLESINASAGLSRDNTAQMAYNAVQAQEVTYNNLFGDYTGVLQTFNRGTMLNIRFGVSKVEGVVVANNIMDIDGEGTTVAGKTRLTDIYVDGEHRVNNVGNVVRLIDDIYPVALDNSYLGQRVVLYVKGLKDLAPNAASTEVISEPILSADNTVATTTSRMKDADAVRSFLSDNGLSIPAAGVAFDADLTNGMVVYTENDTQIFNANNPGDALDRDFAVTNAALNARGTEYTFIDHDGDGTVDFIFHKLARLAKVTVYNEADEELTIAGEGTLDFSDIANPEDVAKDDIVLYYKMNETYYLQVAEVVAGKVESYNNDNNSVKMDGVDYFVSTAGFEASSTDLEDYTPNTMDMVGNTYTFYLDASGNVIAWVLGDEAVGNYALILESKTSDAGTGFATSSVKLLMADGTVGTYSVNLLASANKFMDFLGLANNATAAAKELRMSNWLAAGGGARNSVVTYVIGENGAVTLGDPADVSTVSTVVGQAAGTVTRSTASYNFGNRPDNEGAAVGNLRVNDSTLFFIRNTSVDGNTYSVVKGVSNLPTSTIWKNAAETTPATVEGAAFTNTGTNANVARAVVVDGIYRGTANYVYVSASYTGSLTVNGERVYTYPVVFEDGTAGTLNVNSDNWADGMVYEYTVNSDGVAELERTESTINEVVSTYAKGSNLTLTYGDGSAWNADRDGDGVIDFDFNGDRAVDYGPSFTVLSDAKLWNVNDTDNIYEETLSQDMSLAVVLDGDGFVKTVFVRDTNLTQTLQANLTAVAGLRFAAVLPVYSGFRATVIGAAANETLTYTVTYTNKPAQTGLPVTASNTGAVSISVPRDATAITITSRSNPVTVLDSTATIAQVNTALTTNNVVINGSFDASAKGNTQIVVPDGRTLTVTGTLTLDPVGGMLLNGTVTGSHMDLNGATVGNTDGYGLIAFDTMDWGSTIAAGIAVQVTNNVTLSNDVTMNGKATVGGAIVSTAPAGTYYTISMTQAGASLIVKGGSVAGNIDAAAGTSGTISGTVAGTISGAGASNITVGGTTPEEPDETEVSLTVTAANASVTDASGKSVIGTTNVTKNQTITLTIKADEGYTLDKVTVDGTEVSVGSDGTITISVKEANITVMVSAVEDVRPPVDDLPNAPVYNSATDYTFTDNKHTMTIRVDGDWDADQVKAHVLEAIQNEAKVTDEVTGVTMTDATTVSDVYNDNGSLFGKFNITVKKVWTVSLREASNIIGWAGTGENLTSAPAAVGLDVKVAPVGALTDGTAMSNYVVSARGDAITVTGSVITQDTVLSDAYLIAATGLTGAVGTAADSSYGSAGEINNKYVTAGTWLKVTGANSTAAGATGTLKAGDVVVGSKENQTESPAALVYDPFMVEAEHVKDGKLSLTETAGTVITIADQSVTVNAENKFTVSGTYTEKDALTGDYVAVTAAASIAGAGTDGHYVTIGKGTFANGMVTYTITVKNNGRLDGLKDGAGNITLVAASKVQLAPGQFFVVEGEGAALPVDADLDALTGSGYYLAEGATITVRGKATTGVIGALAEDGTSISGNYGAIDSNGFATITVGKEDAVYSIAASAAGQTVSGPLTSFTAGELSTIGITGSKADGNLNIPALTVGVVDQSKMTSLFPAGTVLNQTAIQGDNMILEFTASANATVELIITKSDDSEIGKTYTEKKTFAEARTNSFFYIALEAGEGKGTNAGEGTIKNAALGDGTYTFQILVNGALYNYGSFTKSST